MTDPLEIVLVHFRAVDLRYLDAAWYSLSRQDFTSAYIPRITVLDNDTPDEPTAIMEVLNRYPVKPAVRLVSTKHGDESKRCQSWSVNEAMRLADAPWVLFCRSDYILDFTLLSKFTQEASTRQYPRTGFVTSYAYHMALDERGDQRIDGFRDIEKHGWRERGAQVLLTEVNGWRVDSSDKDAGVWMTHKALWEQVGGLNEDLRAWGLQQTVFQQALFEAGVDMVQIPEFLFFHQHHGGGFRDYDRAVAELEAHWGPREKLRTFRDISGFVGRVCDELGPPKE